MPTYLTDSPNIVVDIADLRRRLSILENNPSYTQANVTQAAPYGGSTGTSGGTLTDGSVTYVKLAPDVATTFDVRYVNVTGDTMTGALAVNAPMTVGTGGSPQSLVVTGSITGTTSGSFGTLNVSGATTNLTAANSVLNIGAVGSSNAPVFNMHSSLNSTNYDVQLAATGGTAADGAGTFTVRAASTVVTGNLTVNGTFSGTGIVNSVNAGNQTTITGTASAPIVNVVTTPTFTSATIPNLSGAVSIGGATTLTGGISGSVTANTDSTFFVWDGGTSRVGFSKKTGVQGKLAYANTTFAITQYAGQTSIDPANAQTDRLTIDTNGLVTVTGNASIGGTLSVTGVPTFTSAAVFNGGITTKDFITGAAGAGVGNIAAQTIQDYNLKDASISYSKLTGSAQNSIQAFSVSDNQFTFLRRVSSTGTSLDANGKETDGLTVNNAATRVADGSAYAGFAITNAGMTTNALAVSGPGYAGLAPGQYQATYYVRVSSTASTSTVITLQVTGTAVSNNPTITFAPSDLATTYIGVVVPFTITNATNTVNTQVTSNQLPGAVQWWLSHVRVGTKDGTVAAGATQYFFANAAITSAQIASITANQITTGSLTADITQSGIIRTGPDTGARVLINSAGIYAYSTSGTGSPTIQITNTGNVTVTGVINATSGTFTGTISGGTFQGGTFQTGTGTTSVVRFDSTSIRAYNSGGVNTFTVLNDGSLTATAATITGQINATSGTFSGTITATGTISGGTLTSAQITGTNINATNTISGYALTAGTVTTDRLLIGTALTESLILNGGFEEETTVGSGVPTNWVNNYEVNAGGGTLTTTTSNPATGTRSGLITVAANAGDGIASSSVPVVAGQVISIKGRLRANTVTGPFVVRVLFGTTNGFARNALVAATPTYVITTSLNGNTGTAAAGYADLVNLGNAAATGTYYPVEGTVTVPTGATWMRLGLYAWVNASAWSGQFDDWTVSKQITTTEIANGVITTGMIVAGGISGTVIQTNTLTADRIATGTLNASAVVTVGTAANQRVEIDGRAASAGIRLYNATPTVILNADANAGTLTVTGTINATGGNFTGGTITGGTFQGGTFETASGNTNVVRFNSTGIKGYDASSNNVISLSNTGFFVIGQNATGAKRILMDGTGTVLYFYEGLGVSGESPAYIDSTTLGSSYPGFRFRSGTSGTTSRYANFNLTGSGSGSATSSSTLVSDDTNIQAYTGGTNTVGATIRLRDVVGSTDISMTATNIRLNGNVPSFTLGGYAVDGTWTTYTPTTTNITSPGIAGAYKRIGQTLFVIVGTTAGTATANGTVGIGLPAGFTSTTFGTTTHIANLGNGNVVGAVVLANSTSIAVYSNSTGTGFTAGASVNGIRVNLVLWIQ